MNEIKRVLRVAAWRMFLISLIRSFVVALAAAIAAAMLVLIAQRLFDFPVPWWDVAAWAAGAVVASAILWSMLTRADRGSVARRVDEGADLRESLSTALCVAANPDPWSRATVESAAERARGVKVSQAVPIEAPRFWPVPLALALSTVVAYLAVPELDLLGRRAMAVAQEEAEREIVQATAQAQEVDQKVQDLVSKLDLAAPDKDEDAPEAQLPEPRNPEEIRRAAVKKLTNLKDQLEQLKGGEKGQQLQTMQQMLRQIRPMSQGPLAQLSREMAAGKFDKAAEELQKMMNELANGNMTNEQKEQLADQLKKLSEQLEKIAENQKDLERKLEQAGLDKNLAKDPEALKQALENAENLTEEQKEQLAQAAKAQQQACNMCQGMAGSMAQMAAGMGEQGMDQEGMEGMDAMMGQLSELEQLAADMQLADAALSECNAQLSALAGSMPCNNPGMGECEGGLFDGTNPWSAGWREQAGNGSGGPGQGRGGSPGVEETDVSWEKQKFKTTVQAGPIIGSRLVEGESIRGESHAAFAEAVALAEQEAAEALEENIIPREYHDAVKHYFGRLKERSRPAGATPPSPAAPAPATKPAGDAGAK